MMAEADLKPMEKVKCKLFSFFMIKIFLVHIVMSQQVKLVLESPYSNMAAQIAATRR